MTLRFAPCLLSLFVLVTVTAVAVGTAAGDPARPAPSGPLALGNRLCPVEGTPVDPKLHVVWSDLQVGLCCPDCVAKFRAEPQRYTAVLLRDLALQLAEAKAKGAAPTPPPTAAPRPTAPAPAAVVDLANPTCPVMGGQAKEGVSTTYHGMKIRFCCPGCDRRFQADPQTYLQVLRRDPKLAPVIDRAEAQNGGHGGH